MPEMEKNLLIEKIADADMVLVGIGEEFNENFDDIGNFPELTAALAETDDNPSLDWIVPFLEQRFLSEHNDSPAIRAYTKLYGLIKDKNYFIVTTCIDGNIHKADFDGDRIVEPCGNYKMLQCSEKCNNNLYPSDEFAAKLKQAVAQGIGLTSLERPVCPDCGKPLVFNNILCESGYVEEGYMEKWQKYTKWLQFTLNRKLCIIELGVGMSLPSVIRWPFEKAAFYNQKASFFRINGGLYQMTDELSDKGTSIAVNAIEFLEGL
jgi:NAD-dependent SIR2 family protein deacetylase